MKIVQSVDYTNADELAGLDADVLNVEKQNVTDQDLSEIFMEQCMSNEEITETDQVSAMCL